MNRMRLVLGAGVSGLSVGVATNWPVFESTEQPGGICSSYYIRPGETQRMLTPPADGEAYRFDIGGGHWIFGGDPAVLRFIHSLAMTRSYMRRSSVYFRSQDLYVPYPLQNHLAYLDKTIAVKALTEIVESSKKIPRTMAEWFEQCFGKTLTDLFFAPFHQLYTAGLWKHIAPQDVYKSPIDLSLVLQGALDKTPPVGYNATFVYPVEGLDSLVRCLEKRCRVHYGKKVVEIDVGRKQICFADGSGILYERMISTLPLNQMMKMSNLTLGADPDPYTSVLVLNIGGIRGARCPDDHWLYIPESRSGFYRIGFYSNVDACFLPAMSRSGRERVSIYVERAYLGGNCPSQAEVQSYSQMVVEELKEWGFIEAAEVVDPTWIDVAYTWSWPGSVWKQQALAALEKHDIYQVGRYGRWVFQGIADSIRDGLVVGITSK